MSDQGRAIGIFAVIAAVLGLLIWGVSQLGRDPLGPSPLGFRGLVALLDEGGQATQAYHRRTTLSEGDVALRILPIYDVDLRGWHRGAEESENPRYNETQIDLDQSVVLEKMNALETLVVLPKWRTGVLELNVVDQQLLNVASNVDLVLDQLGLSGVRVERFDAKLWSEDDITIYRPQFLSLNTNQTACKPFLNTTRGVLIAQCTARTGEPRYILSDPDLLNNHGLSLGANANVAKDVISRIVRQKPGLVYLDTAEEYGLATDGELVDERPPEPRSMGELSRLLHYPFNVIWTSFGLAFLVAFWRGLIRFGSLSKPFTDQLEASKTASIKAKAGLLRLAGQDHVLVGQHVRNRLAELSRTVLGKKVEPDTLFKHLATLSPDTGRQLRASVEALSQTSAATPDTELAEKAGHFDALYRRLNDELGRISTRR